MFGRRFLSWAQRASATERAAAALSLATAYLHAELDPIECGEIERLLTGLLDDPSPLVRHALAEGLAEAAGAPHHILSALTRDQADIAATILGRSPVLCDAELIDAAALGEDAAQCAIAGRARLSAAVSGAVAEIGRRDAVLILCGNDGAVLADLSVARILVRFGQDGAIREALVGRIDLSPEMRHRLALATAEALRRFATECRWMSPGRADRIAGEAADQVALTLAQDGADGAAAARLRFVRYLRVSGRLTPAFLIRALLSGQRPLFEAALSDVSGQSLGRVAGLVRNTDGLGFAALCRAAGLADAYLPAIRAALSADCGDAQGSRGRPALRSRIVTQVIEACDETCGQPAGLTALLRGFEAEAWRAERRLGGIDGEPRGGGETPVRIDIYRRDRRLARVPGQIAA